MHGEAAPRSWKQRLDISASVIMIVAAATVLWATLGRGPTQPVIPSPSSQVSLPSSVVSLEGATSLGNDAAKLVMIEFMDYECQYCVRFASESMPILRERFIEPGLVRFVIRHSPLEGHTKAMRAAGAAECAKALGQFWPMHEVLLENSGALGDIHLGLYAEHLGLDKQRFLSCLDDGVATSQVSRDLAQARELGVRSTPLFMLGYSENGGVRIVSIVGGAQPTEVFIDAIDALLDERGARQEATGGN